MDDNTFKVILAIVAMVQVVALSYLGVQARANTSKLETVSSTADATHTLVNSNMGAQLSVGATALKRIAELTGSPADKLVADDAQAKLDDHVAKQAAVDSSSKAVPLTKEEQLLLSKLLARSVTQ